MYPKYIPSTFTGMVIRTYYITIIIGGMYITYYFILYNCDKNILYNDTL